MSVENDMVDFIRSSCEPYLDKQTIKINAKKIAEAINKQIPRKPMSLYPHRTKKVCPACETVRSCRILMGWEKHCPDCGQAIDWSDSK